MKKACTSILTIISPFKKKITFTFSIWHKRGWDNCVVLHRARPKGAPVASGVAPGPVLWSPQAVLGCVLLPGPLVPAWPQMMCWRQAGVQGRLCATEQGTALLALGTHTCSDQQ